MAKQKTQKNKKLSTSTVKKTTDWKTQAPLTMGVNSGRVSRSH
jgi:hypothetical protein